MMKMSVRVLNNSLTMQYYSLVFFRRKHLPWPPSLFIILHTFFPKLFYLEKSQVKYLRSSEN